jgi:two-component system chemotaxis response regulator CheB
VLVVVHAPPVDDGLVAAGFARGSRLPVVAAEHGMPVAPGRVVVAPRDRHMLVSEGRIVLSSGPRENLSRPAIDPLFRSVAVAYSTRVIGVVLTGYLDDGAAGLAAIHRCGGVTVAQDPADAEFPDMPRAALATGVVHHVTLLAQIAPLLEALTCELAPTAGPVPEDVRLEARIAAEAAAGIDLPAQEGGELSVYTCPECSGALWRVTKDGLERYRCHAGHAVSLQALVVGKTAELERALGTALRILDERVGLARRLGARAAGHGLERLARRYETQIAEYGHQADSIRRVLLDQQRDADIAPEIKRAP